MVRFAVMMMLWLTGSTRVPVTVALPPKAPEKAGRPAACALSASRCAAVPLAAPVRRMAQETAVMRDGIPRPRFEPLALPGRVAPDGWPARRTFGVSMLLGRARPAAGSPAWR